MFTSKTVSLLLLSLSSASAKLGGPSKNERILQIQTEQGECFTRAQRDGQNYGLFFMGSNPTSKIDACSGDCGKKAKTKNSFVLKSFE